MPNMVITADDLNFHTQDLCYRTIEESIAPGSPVHFTENPYCCELSHLAGVSMNLFFQRRQTSLTCLNCSLLVVLQTYIIIDEKGQYLSLFQVKN